MYLRERFRNIMKEQRDASLKRNKSAFTSIHAHKRTSFQFYIYVALCSSVRLIVYGTVRTMDRRQSHIQFADGILIKFYIVPIVLIAQHGSLDLAILYNQTQYKIAYHG